MEFIQADLNKLSYINSLLPTIPNPSISTYNYTNQNCKVNESKSNTAQNNIFADGVLQDEYVFESEIPLILDDFLMVPENTIPYINENIERRLLLVNSSEPSTINNMLKTLNIPMVNLSNNMILIDKFGPLSEIFSINWYKVAVLSRIFKDKYPWNVYLNMINDEFKHLDNKEVIRSFMRVLRSPFRWSDLYTILNYSDINVILSSSYQSVLCFKNITNPTHKLNFINRKNIEYVREVTEDEVQFHLTNSIKM